MEFDDLFKSITEATENEMCGAMDHEYPDGENTPRKKPMDGDESMEEGGEEAPDGDMTHVFNPLAAGEGLAEEVGEILRGEIERYKKDYPDGDYSAEGDFYKTVMEEVAKQVSMVFEVPAEMDGEGVPAEMDGKGAQGEEGVNPEEDVEEMGEKPGLDTEGVDYKAMDAKKKYESRVKDKKNPPAKKKD